MLSFEQRRVLMRNLEVQEGRVNHMYLDSKGFVTVGVGHFIANVQAAQRLPFKRRGGQEALSEEIKDDFEAVKIQPANRFASFYRSHTKLVLAGHEIDQLTSAHIDSFHRELRAVYPEFETFPWEAKLALFDIIFNIGQTKLQGGWPNMNSAIRALDWTAAAKHSRRAPPVAEERNRYVAELFKAAAGTKK